MAKAISCHYVRAAIYELSAEHREAEALFEKVVELFPSMKENWSPDRFRNAARRLREVMHRAWKGGPTARANFLEKFSCKNWKKLNKGRKDQHTATDCRGCQATSSSCDDARSAFPVRASQSESNNHAPLSQTCGNNQRGGLTPAKDANLQKRQAANERRQLKRKHVRDFKAELEKRWDESAMETVLQERFSYSQWDRAVYRQSFETPQSKRRRYDNGRTSAGKSHSPRTQPWDTDAVLTAARAWQPDSPAINWSALAREHHIPGPNGGQTAKEFLQANGIDVLKMERRTAPRKRLRRRRLTFACGVTHPVQKRHIGIKEDIKQAVQDGRYSIGEECTGTVLCKYTLADGRVVPRELQVYGCKVPMIELRQRLLRNHEDMGLMRKRTAVLEEYASLSRDDLKQRLTHLGEFVADTEDTTDLCTRLYQYEHTRLLLLANDHADILGHEYMMEVVQVVYDTALFLTDKEFADTFGQNISVQSAVEAPAIRLIAMSGSSDAEQLRAVPDRVADLHCIESPIERQDGDPIIDRLVGYSGDLQARWMEAGLQKGGTFRCGSGCGLRISYFPSFASTVNRKIPSFLELQRCATAGRYGKVAGKNLHDLPAAEVRTELESRGIDVSAAQNVTELRPQLRELLQGVQRVPALLSFRPQQPLSRHALQHYEVLPCEPLHDCKGHIAHVLRELPGHVDHHVASVISDIVDATVNRDHSRGCDWRRALFLVTAAVLDLPQSTASVNRLLRTLVDITKALYAPELQRCPKMVLHLTLCLWRHMEMLVDVIGVPKVVSTGTLYGGYLHDLLHSPLQLMVMSARSGNTESLERLQGQARNIAEATSSRRPNDIAATVLLRSQAEAEGRLQRSLDDTESQLAKLARQLPPSPDTIVDVTTLDTERRLSNFAALQEAISPFLRGGPGVWWHREGNFLWFHDGENQEENRPQGPLLHHLRSSSIQGVQHEKEQDWEWIGKHKVELPVPHPGSATGAGHTLEDNVDRREEQDDTHASEAMDTLSSFTATSLFYDADSGDSNDGSSSASNISGVSASSFGSNANTTSSSSSCTTSSSATTTQSAFNSGSDSNRGGTDSRNSGSSGRITSGEGSGGTSRSTSSDSDSSSSNCNNQHDSTPLLHSKVAKQVVKLTGYTKSLAQYDHLRCQAKACQTGGGEFTECEKDALQSAESEVIAEVKAAHLRLKSSVRPQGSEERVLYQLSKTMLLDYWKQIV